MTKKRTTPAKKPHTKKTTAKRAPRKNNKKNTRQSLIVVILAIIAIVIAAWALIATQQQEPPAGTVSDDPKIQALIDTAGDLAENGSPQEALNAYEELMDASEDSDVEVWATAEANASTFQAIVDAEEAIEKLDEQEQTITDTKASD